MKKADQRKARTAKGEKKTSDTERTLEEALRDKDKYGRTKKHEEINKRLMRKNNNYD